MLITQEFEQLVEYSRKMDLRERLGQVLVAAVFLSFMLNALICGLVYWKLFGLVPTLMSFYVPFVHVGFLKYAVYLANFDGHL
jgi:hypothetical protein